MGDFSHTNDSVLQQLRAHFPHLDADVIDAGRLGIVRRSSLFRMVLAVAGEFGLEACRSRDLFYRHLLKTRHYFASARAALQRRLSDTRYAFTFQTQTLFDASCAGTPHFVYTDHTHLENLKYGAGTSATAISRGWAEIERGAFHNASMVFTMSHNISRSLIEEYGCAAEKIACVYAGGNVAPLDQPLDDSRFGSKHILFVGVDWERKGGPELLALSARYMLPTWTLD